MYYSQGENKRKRWYRMLTIGQKKLLFLVVLLLVALFAFLGTVIVYSVRAAEYDLSLVTRPVGGGMLYDSRNEPVAPLGANTYVPVRYGDLPKNLVNAFLAREDEHFFEHSGVVYSAVLRSALRNITSMRYEQGASTISMQLTRNVYDLQDKTLDRKLLEVFLTRRIEDAYDKKTILTQYLNRIYFGQGCYGVGTAAQYYFGKQVKDLDLVECATLAGLVRGPSIFNPVASMPKALNARNETLARMLSEGMITQEEYEAAKAAPIALKAPEQRKADENSYPTMWAKQELDSLRADLGDGVDGASVGSTLCMPVQLMVEEAMEDALVAVETPGYFPERWAPFLPEGEAAAEGAKTAFNKLRRPKALKPRGYDNDLTGKLQCCVLVVDMRRGSQGDILAVVSGRSVADGRDRWQEKVQPGRTIAPLVFCCACLPGADDQHIVARSAEVTGRRLGYDTVHAFISGLGLDLDLPTRENADDLYNGLFLMRRVDLARVLFSVRNQGRGYQLSMVNTVWNRANKPIYARSLEKAPEYIRRESASSVENLAPFVCADGRPTVLSEILPDGYGCWTMVCNDRGVAVFVWMGFDDPTSEAAQAPEMRKLLSTASLYLAREVHANARTYLRSLNKKDSPKK